MYKPTFALTEEDKRVLADINGKITIGCLERRSTFEMAQKLKLQPYELEHNIDEMLYVLLKHVGVKRFLKTLLRK